MRDAIKIAVLISGSGSNLQAIIDSIKSNNIACDIQLVVSNKALAYGLTRAHEAQLKTMTIDHKQYPDRQSFDEAIASEIEKASIDYIVLAGFMRIFSAWFVQRFRNRMINIHPSLLPDFKGLNTHQRVLTERSSHHGATVHLVTPELDDGPGILQGRISVNAQDTVESLKQRVHQVEHKIYPEVICWLASRRLLISTQNITLDGIHLPENGKVIDYDTI